ncbi:hypothetical protein [Skermania piniformis]|uniref:NfeD-like C-terminal domain-containing protein n=1 Tax=Skermania pinensis TaxID=39122 RepID=A0ABX8SGP5_9ACTN|nr:hypothetical protein [Skermania piniformis]QXQ14851.1 hypothetical protein KV203_05570 [Skermania piniformis]
MTDWLLAAILVVVAAAAVAELARRVGAGRHLHRRRVVVNLRSGNAVGGVITSSVGRYYTVSDAQIHELGQPAPVPADGAIVIAKDHVDYVQVL